MAVAAVLSIWAQAWLQLSAFAAVRPRPPSFERVRQVAYGTTRNRHERDHDGLAVRGMVLTGRCLRRVAKPYVEPVMSG